MIASGLTAISQDSTFTITFNQLKAVRQLENDYTYCMDVVEYNKKLQKIQNSKILNLQSQIITLKNHNSKLNSIDILNQNICNSEKEQLTIKYNKSNRLKWLFIGTTVLMSVLLIRM